MKFGRPDRRNPAPEISDLYAEIVTNEDGTARLRLHLTMGYVDLSIDGRDFEVGTTEALLHIECEGVEIDPWSKHNQVDRTGFARTTVTTEAVVKSHAKAGGSASIDVVTDAAMPSASGSISLSAGGGLETQATKTAVSSEEIKSLNVVALGGNRWRIREAAKPRRLEGKYLGDEDLCSVTLVGGSNRQHILATVEIKQKDLVFNPTPDTLLGNLRGSRTSDKLKGILLAKSLHEALNSERSFMGKLVLSAVDCEVSAGEEIEDDG